MGIGTAAPSNQLSVQGDADFAGSVGIGTNNPQAELDIASLDTVGTITVQPNSAGNITELVLAEDINADFAMITRYDGDVNQLHFIARQSGVETAPLVSIDRSSAGNVGIGTTAPGFQLEVNGSAGKPGGGLVVHFVRSPTEEKRGGIQWFAGQTDAAAGRDL